MCTQYTVMWTEMFITDRTHEKNVFCKCFVCLVYVTYLEHHEQSKECQRTCSIRLRTIHSIQVNAVVLHCLGKAQTKWKCWNHFYRYNCKRFIHMSDHCESLGCHSNTSLSAEYEGHTLSHFLSACGLLLLEGCSAHWVFVLMGQSA